ncbi:MAG: DUF1570 domain-containing protein [Planctomycetaceae bacterium]
MLAQNQQLNRRVLILGLAVFLGILPGCLRMTRHKQQVVTKPGRHSLQLDNLLLLSDFKIARDHELIGELEQLREDIVDTLKLPPQRDQVTVYLFSDRLSYQAYLDTTWPDLPERRAYFVGTSRELAVYTFWGSRTLEDLRHEYTHGILHASLNAVPLWLDEGLAEYFEVRGRRVGSINSEHASELSDALSNGWEPDLKRLENITEFSELQRLDYQESWAWVHYMLHMSPETQVELRDYLHELRTKSDAGPISERLADLTPEFENRFRVYAGSLNSATAVIRAQEYGEENRP